VIVNQIIPISNIGNLSYNSIPDIPGMFDPFTFSVSGTTQPDLYSNITTLTATRS